MEGEAAATPKRVILGSVDRGDGPRCADLGSGGDSKFGGGVPGEIRGREVPSLSWPHPSATPRRSGGILGTWRGQVLREGRACLEFGILGA